MESFYDTIPKRILHYNKPQQTAAVQIAAAAAYNLRLSKRESALLQFYASRSNHFTPSRQMIADTCDIPINKIWETRNKLHRKKLIKVNSSSIIVDWYRLRNFAMMERQSKSGALHATYGSPEDTMKTVGQLVHEMPMDKDIVIINGEEIQATERYFYLDAPFLGRRPCALSKDDPFLRAIMSMTVREYYDWLAFPFPEPVAHPQWDKVAQ